MRKLAEISLRGISPETVIQNSQPPEPMETPGYSKAKAILEMASQTKTADARIPLPTVRPSAPGISLRVKSDPSKIQDMVAKATAKQKALASAPPLDHSPQNLKSLKEYPDQKLFPQWKALDEDHGVSSRAQSVVGKFKNVIASVEKTASRHAGSPATLPQIEKLLEKHKEDDSIERQKRLAGYMLAGGGSANFVAAKVINSARNVTGFHPPKPGASKLELAATLAGMASGAAEAYRRSRKAKKKTAEATTPGMQLSASKAVGRLKQETGENVGKTPQQQIRGRLMGKKFVRHEKVAMAHGSEELDRVRAVVLTREDTRAAADVLFGEKALDARRKEREMVAKLFLQAPAAQTMTPMLQKEASIEELAPNTVSFLEKNAKALGITEAQMRYPELLKVAAGRAADVPVHSAIGSKRAVQPTSGPTPTQSQGSGGSA